MSTLNAVAGFSLSACIQKATPLMFAAIRGNVPIVNWLLSNGANVNAVEEGCAWQPIIHASQGGHTEARYFPRSLAYRPYFLTPRFVRTGGQDTSVAWRQCECNDGEGRYATYARHLRRLRGGCEDTSRCETFLVLVREAFRGSVCGGTDS